MKQEVRNFLQKFSKFSGIVQRCSFKLGNEHGQHFSERFYWHDCNIAVPYYIYMNLWLELNNWTVAQLVRTVARAAGSIPARDV
jgi:hypothetical protein